MIHKDKITGIKIKKVSNSKIDKKIENSSLIANKNANIAKGGYFMDALDD